jgi:hypothetical protein
MKPAVVATLCLYLTAAMPASAAETDANACGATLDRDARLVFDAVMADPQPGEALRKLLAFKVSGLVADGKLSIFSARSAATAASECLRIARECTAEIC